MSKRFYLVTRDLHLYAGLFISPFVVVFAVSVFALVHPPGAAPPTRWLVSPDRLRIYRSPRASRAFPDEPEWTRCVLCSIRRMSAGRSGSSHTPKETRTQHPGERTGARGHPRSRPLHAHRDGHGTQYGIVDALILLHKSPARTADIRVNWYPALVWRWLADSTCYLLFFITISGIYMWFVLRSERRIGIVLLAAGMVSFFRVLYAIAG